MDDQCVYEHQARLTAVETAIEDLKRRRERMLDPLGHLDSPTPAFVQNLNEGAAKIVSELETVQARLRQLREEAPARPCPELLDLLPTGTINLEQVPGPVCVVPPTGNPANRLQPPPAPA